jgi:lipid-binding SYLF domain-containing protein
MCKTRTSLVISLLLLTLAETPLRAGHPEMATVESAVDTVKGFSALPLKCIPPSLLHDAKAVAVFPNVIKAGLLLDKRYGRGVVLVRQPDGGWSDPLFVTFDGGGIGLQAGVQSTELVLVFKTRSSVERILNGKLTLGSDVAVSVGPVGREAEAASDGRLIADIYSYSRSRGLFVGASLEGVRLKVDDHSNEVFYNLRGCRPEDVLNHRGPALPPVEALKAELTHISTPPAVIVPRP